MIFFFLMLRARGLSGSRFLSLFHDWILPSSSLKRSQMSGSPISISMELPCTLARGYKRGTFSQFVQTQISWAWPPSHLSLNSSTNLKPDSHQVLFLFSVMYTTPCWSLTEAINGDLTMWLLIQDLRPHRQRNTLASKGPLRLVPAPLAAMYSLRCTGSGGRRGCQVFSFCFFPPLDYLQVSSLERQPSVWEVSSFLVLMSKPAACCWNLAGRAPDSRTVPHALLSGKGTPCEQLQSPGSDRASSCSPGLGGRGGPTEDLSPASPREPQRRGLGQRGDSTISPRLVRYQHQQPLP
ncbi:unnamed protein product [Nyctereutes procyonoides]|uniref:(raccoon dog) hypothetical protein n=1 Tax=Nyctereutes procyonoides TaxID=34880 RepID=A0A811XS54_NYCPR|nr:unnamed protein product [Nyctereutes procyonoides]